MTEVESAVHSSEVITTGMWSVTIPRYLSGRNFEARSCATRMTSGSLYFWLSSVQLDFTNSEAGEVEVSPLSLSSLSSLESVVFVLSVPVEQICTTMPG